MLKINSALSKNDIIDDDDGMIEIGNFLVNLERVYYEGKNYKVYLSRTSLPTE